MDSRTWAWRRLHAFDSRQLHERWQARGDVLDPLRLRYRSLDDDGRDGVWTVNTRAELLRLVGALQHQNAQLMLWFRGESHLWQDAKAKPKMPRRAQPSAFRSDEHWRHGIEYLKWLDSTAADCLLLRDRGEIARLAILQHYGAPTAFLDVTTSPDVAAAFAVYSFVAMVKGQALKCRKDAKRDEPEPTISVFVTPRIQTS